MEIQFLSEFPYKTDIFFNFIISPQETAIDRILTRNEIRNIKWL